MGEFRGKKNIEDYEVWDEERKVWCDYKDSCYIKTTLGGFPSPEKANQEILAITCKVLGKDTKFICFGTKELKNALPEDVIYHQCRHENDLLATFLLYFQEVNPDIITGWNTDGFDIPYIINRSNKVLGENVTRKFSPFYKNLDKCIVEEKYGVNDTLTYKIVGISKLDFIDLYKKYSYSTLESYRLEVVGQHELGEGKIDYSEYRNLMDLYEKNYDKFLEYNIHDVRLVENLEFKLNFLFQALSIAYLGKIRYNEIHSQVRFWDNYIYNALLQEGIQIPPTTRKEHKDIVGAYVKDPVSSLYKWIVTMDLTSLYPSIIMSWNISPETQATSAIYSVEDIDQFINMKIDASHLKNSDLTMLANGACFRRNIKGVFPDLIDKMFASRKMYKGKMIEAQKELEEIENEMRKRGLVI